MLLKVWYCFEEQCITPCIFPFHEYHDRPDGCCWDGISDFRIEFIEDKELLRIFNGGIPHENNKTQ